MLFKNQGTCSSAVDIDVDAEGIVRNVKFVGGCPGNTAGIALLARGRPAKELVAMLKGVRCGTKPTSCPDQLARHLEEILAQNAAQ